MDQNVKKYIYIVEENVRENHHDLNYVKNS